MTKTPLDGHVASTLQNPVSQISLSLPILNTAVSSVSAVIYFYVPVTFVN